MKIKNCLRRKKMQFGYNCKYYLPWFEKCSILIKKRKSQKDLLQTKWLSVKEALIYSYLLKFDLWNSIEKEKVEIKKTSKSNVKIGFNTAWQYDECQLAHNGGRCIYFEEHKDNKISCLLEIKEKNPHPNTPKIPNDDDIEKMKQKILKLIHQKTNKNENLLF